VVLRLPPHAFDPWIQPELFLGVLTRRYGDFGAATHWPGDGIPGNPRGWLIQAASRALTIDMQEDPDFADGMLQRLLGPHLSSIADRLVAAQAAGQVRTDLDMAIAVEWFVGSPYHRWLLRTAPLTEQYADSATDLALRAMRP